MRRMYKLNSHDEFCRVMGALGTHSLVIGGIMACFPNTQTIGLILAGTGLFFTVGAVKDLLKR